MNLRKLVIGLPVVALSAGLAATTARADVDIYKGSDLSVTGALVGAVGAIGSATRGNGDAVQNTSTTSATPSYLAMESYYLGWRSGAALEGWGDDAVDFSLGNQPLTIGDGLLINGAVTNAFQRGAYYLSP